MSYSAMLVCVCVCVCVSVGGGGLGTFYPCYPSRGHDTFKYTILNRFGVPTTQKCPPPLDPLGPWALGSEGALILVF